MLVSSGSLGEAHGWEGQANVLLLPLLNTRGANWLPVCLQVDARQSHAALLATLLEMKVNVRRKTDRQRERRKREWNVIVGEEHGAISIPR